MPLLELRSFEDGLIDSAKQLVHSIEQLERLRRDTRTTALLVRARQFLAHVETYFAVGRRR